MHRDGSESVTAFFRFLSIGLNGITGVEDLQEENCKLGVYNAEKGERGILSLQVDRRCLMSWPINSN